MRGTGTGFQWNPDSERNLIANCYEIKIKTKNFVRICIPTFPSKYPGTKWSIFLFVSCNNILTNIIILEKSRLAKGSEFHATINFDDNNSCKINSQREIYCPPMIKRGSTRRVIKREIAGPVFGLERKIGNEGTVEEPFAGKSRWYSTNVCETRCLNSLKGGGCLSSKSCGN